MRYNEVGASKGAVSGREVVLEPNPGPREIQARSRGGSAFQRSCVCAKCMCKDGRSREGVVKLEGSGSLGGLAEDEQWRGERWPAKRLWPHGKGCFEDTGVHAKGCRSLQFFLTLI